MNIKRLIRKGISFTMPKNIKRMLATLVNEPVEKKVCVMKLNGMVIVLLYI